MTGKALNDRFSEAMLLALEETFENVHGMYLDRGTSVFETLATISGVSSPAHSPAEPSFPAAPMVFAR